MNTTSQSQIHAGVAVMVFKDGKILLAQRKKSPSKGEYGLPGGHLEYLELFVQCAEREVEEECGVTIENVEFLCAGNITRFAPEQYFHIGVQAQLKSGDVHTMEPDIHSEWKWYSLDALPQPLSVFTEITLQAYKTKQQFFDGI